MRTKTKFKRSYTEKNMYTWVFVNGVMTVAKDERYNLTLKESYVHRIPYYELEIKLNEKKARN